MSCWMLGLCRLSSEHLEGSASPLPTADHPTLRAGEDYHRIPIHLIWCDAVKCAHSVQSPKPKAKNYPKTEEKAVNGLSIQNKAKALTARSPHGPS